MNIKLDIKYKNESSIFENISQKSWDKICLNSTIFSLKRNHYLYTDNQKLEFVYFILEGKVTLGKSNRNGDTRIIFILNKGDMINPPFMRKNTSALECWGFEDALILKISFEDFDKIMSTDYNLAKNCMIFFEKRMRQLYRQLKNSFTNTNLEKRLASKLYRLAIKYGNKNNEDDFTLIDLNLNTILLGKMLGCHRESISRTLKILNAKELIKQNGKNFYINMHKTYRFLKN